MQKEFYNITKKEEFIIYGYGHLGRKLEKYLIKKGYRVVEYLDRNAKNIVDENNTIPIRILEEDEIYDRDNKIVVICLHNALWHAEIAHNLYSIGYEKIIFLPCGNIKTSSDYYLMIDIYNRFIGENINEEVLIPRYTSILNANSDIVSQDEKNVVVWISWKYLFSSTLEMLKENMISRDIILEQISESRDISIANDSIYWQLYKYLDSGEGDIESYTEFRRILDLNFNSNIEVIQNYQQLYYFFEEQRNVMSSYFEKAPIDVMYGEKKRFNIVDGTHRCMYLIYNKIMKMPVRIKIEEYKLYMKDISLEVIPENIELWENRILFNLYHYMSKNKIRGNVIIDSKKNGRFLYQELCRYGLKKCDLLDLEIEIFDDIELIIYEIEEGNSEAIIKLNEYCTSNIKTVIVIVNDISLEFEKDKRKIEKILSFQQDGKKGNVFALTF